MLTFFSTILASLLLLLHLFKPPLRHLQTHLPPPHLLPIYHSTPPPLLRRHHRHRRLLLHLDRQLQTRPLRLQPPPTPPHKISHPIHRHRLSPVQNRIIQLLQIQSEKAASKCNTHDRHQIVRFSVTHQFGLHSQGETESTYLTNHLLVFVSSFVIFTVTGLDIEPPSDEPYLATSLQNFWGRRWNLTVTNTLRHTVYKPVKLFFSGNEWDWVPAVLATFIVSGLMHELLLYHVTKGVSPTWEMTSFFGLHEACVVVEVAVKRAVAGKLEFPVVVSRVLTVGFVVATSFWLFFPPLIENGADVKSLEEFKLFADYLKTMVRFGSS